MQTGRAIYGIQGRRDYAFAPITDRVLFALGANVDGLVAEAICPGDDRLGPSDVGHLPIVDYEIIQGHLYIAHFGDIIGRNLDCADCEKKFAVEFSLGTFMAMLADEVTQDRTLEFRGHAYRLPSRAAVSHGSPEQLPLSLWDGAATAAPSEIEAFEAHLARVCPQLIEDIAAACPRCGRSQSYRFSLRRHLAERLRARLQNLVAQIHILASRYHWTVPDILALGRESRLALVETVRRQGRRASAAMPG